jgi:hypothetical protein
MLILAMEDSASHAFLLAPMLGPRRREKPPRQPTPLRDREAKCVICDGVLYQTQRMGVTTCLPTSKVLNCRKIADARFELRRFWKPALACWR